MECAGGEYLAKPPKVHDSHTIVVSCEDDKKLWTSAARLGLDVVGAEFIMTGLLRQQRMVKRFKLH